MSFYFNIQTTKTLTYQTLRDHLNIPGVSFFYPPDDLNIPIRGTKIYLPGKSTRGITIAMVENGFDVGINVVLVENRLTE